MSHLFVYGTLMVSGLVKQITGKAFASQRATLKGYKRYQVINANYPAIARDKNTEVHGVILRNVDDKSMELLVAYEGMQYKKEKVSVVTGGKKIRAWVFVWDDEFGLLSNGE